MATISGTCIRATSAVYGCERLQPDGNFDESSSNHLPIEAVRESPETDGEPSAARSEFAGDPADSSLSQAESHGTATGEQPEEDRAKRR